MKKIVLAVCCVALLLTGFVGSASALNYHGYEIPETLSIEPDTQLVLNGLGFRSKFFLKIYVGALYLQEKDTSAQRIIHADKPMCVRMHFTYKDVPKKRFLATLEEGFATATKGKVAPLRQRMDALFASLPDGFKKNDYLDVTYTPGKGTVIYSDGKALTTIPGLDFKQAMFAIWLGEEPITEKLKAEMLGMAD